MSLSQILCDARTAKAQTGRSVLAQLFEIPRLRYGPFRLRAEEYFDYRLFDPAITWMEKQAFVGSWVKDRIFRIQNAEAVALGSDKLRTYRHLESCGLPYPRLIAVTQAGEPFSDIVTLNTEAALTNWLRTAPYPFFSKPAVSYRGYGNRLVERYDSATEMLHFRDGSSETVTDFSARHGRPGSPPMLFQQLIRPHASLRALIGDRAATARIIVLNDGAEPEIWRGGFRIPSGSSMVDNFHGGKSGAMLARINLETGAFKDVLSGIGLNWQTIDCHPDTNAPYAGFVLPDWPEARRLVIAGSKAMPGLKIHAWDVAFTDSGPMLIETNPRCDFGIPQITEGQGLAVPRFRNLYTDGNI